MFVMSQSNVFQSSLMFTRKAGAYPSEAPFRCSTIGKAPDITNKKLYWAGKVYQGRTL